MMQNNSTFSYLQKSVFTVRRGQTDIRGFNWSLGPSPTQIQSLKHETQHLYVHVLI